MTLIKVIHDAKNITKAKKRNKSVSCSRSENCNAECGFLFYFYNLEKAMRNTVFNFLTQLQEEIHENNSLGFFLTFIKNITTPVSYNGLYGHLFYMHSVHLD